MILRVLAIAVIASFFCACSTMSYAWSKPGAGTSEFYRDRADCTAMSNSGPRRSNVWTPVSKQWSDNVGYNMNRGLENASDNRDRAQLFNDCMMGRGWYLVPR